MVFGGGGEGWRVDNLGLVGYGPDRMLRALEQVGVALGPASHDFSRVMPPASGVGFPVPRFALVDDRRRAAYAVEQRVPFIELTEPLRAAGFDRVYIPDDARWKAEGHRVVAEALRPFLASLLR